MNTPSSIFIGRDPFENTSEESLETVVVDAGNFTIQIVLLTVRSRHEIQRPQN